MSKNEHDMLIRHDEQLRALSKLPDAVAELSGSIGQLRAELGVSRAYVYGVAAAIGTACSVVAVVGTWWVMVLLK